MNNNQDKNIGIIGGGYAGMAAAVALSARGIPVTVFESARQLGGRARGVMHCPARKPGDNSPPFQLSPSAVGKSNRPLQGENIILDNGQHLLLGCYHQTLSLIEQVGGDIEADCLRLPLQLDLHGQFSLRAPRLPAPLHLLIALLRARGLSWTERLSAARFMLRLRNTNFLVKNLPFPQKNRGGDGRGERAFDMTVAELLSLNKQSATLVQKLWEPLCIAALNTPVQIASAQVLLNVLRDALNRTRADSDMLIPRLDFTALFPQRAAHYVRKHGGHVLTSCGVESLELQEYGVKIATSRGSLFFSHVICAASPSVAARLLRPVPGLETTLAQIDSLEHQPIYTVYLQYPAHIRLPLPMQGLHQRVSQWLFDKGQIAGQQGLIAAVISAEGLHQQLSHDELAQSVIAELDREFGITERPVWHKVIAEKRATFACTPGLPRPHQQTAQPCLLLAGDYTAGDYPATLEGAVLSGLRCAELLNGAEWP